MTPLLLVLALATAPAPASPWDGTWTLDLARSSAVAKEGAADGYRFHVDPGGAIRWEIPSLGEEATGRTDGGPMVVHRPTPTHGLTLHVTAQGPRTLVYRVTNDKGLQGGGQMTLIDDGTAWVDLTWAAGRPMVGYAIVYVKKS